MAKFTYKARTLAGQAVEGVLEAENDRAASARLSTEGLFPVAIRQKEMAAAAGDAVKPPRRADVNQFCFFHQHT